MPLPGHLEPGVQCGKEIGWPGSMGYYDWRCKMVRTDGNMVTTGSMFPVGRANEGAWPLASLMIM